MNGPAGTGADLHWGLTHTNYAHAWGHASQRRTFHRPGRSRAIRFSAILSLAGRLTWALPGFLSGLSVGFSHRSVVFLMTTRWWACAGSLG
jgi:hypothetical protein